MEPTRRRHQSRCRHLWVHQRPRLRKKNLPAKPPNRPRNQPPPRHLLASPPSRRRKPLPLSLPDSSNLDRSHLPAPSSCLPGSHNPPQPQPPKTGMLPRQHSPRTDPPAGPQCPGRASGDPLLSPADSGLVSGPHPSKWPKTILFPRGKPRSMRASWLG